MIYLVNKTSIMNMSEELTSQRPRIYNEMFEYQTYGGYCSM